MCSSQGRAYTVSWLAGVQIKSYVIATSDLWFFIHASNLLSSTHHPTPLHLFCALLFQLLSNMWLPSPPPHLCHHHLSFFPVFCLCHLAFLLFFFVLSFFLIFFFVCSFFLFLYISLCIRSFLPFIFIVVMIFMIIILPPPLLLLALDLPLCWCECQSTSL